MKPDKPNEEEALRAVVEAARAFAGQFDSTRARALDVEDDWNWLQDTLAALDRLNP